MWFTCIVLTAIVAIFLITAADTDVLSDDEIEEAQPHLQPHQVNPQPMFDFDLGNIIETIFSITVIDQGANEPVVSTLLSKLIPQESLLSSNNEHED